MGKGTKQLFIQTTSLIAGFMVWALISSLMPFIDEDLHMSAAHTAWIIAIPVFLGSIFRIPMGYFTDLFGARKLFAISFLVLILPIVMISRAESFASLLAGSLLLGLGGSIFSVGTTSLPKYFSKDKHGAINGLYGIGTIGTAITAFLAPVLASGIGWRNTVQLYIFLVVIFAMIHLLFGDKQERKVDEPIMSQVKKVYKNKKLWLLCLFYFLTFGSFIAFTVYLPIFLVKYFELTSTDAGIRTAIFIVISLLFRVAGGWFSDKINPYFVLILAFAGLSFAGILLSFTPSLPLFSFGCLLVAVCSGLGNGTVFKLVPLYFFKQAGIVNGLVTAMGGLGGFFPPMIVGAIYSVTGHHAIGFMGLSELALACMILSAWTYYHERKSISEQIILHSNEGITVTDTEGIILKVNPAFTRITGYTLEEVIGKTPSVLQSGEHDNEFYRKMWFDLKVKDCWEGLIWNKRKNGEIYQEYLTIKAIKDDAGETKNFIGVFREID
ncbi:nitrate/nitrite transporter [Neobacillus notoginsengisoli]|uniref:Nitrate/nitrite transporter n=1 Tax=Neobacillus notoginsengisoli TaxID=1578198 RepID=A0A417YX80_9BACI|nr:NarK/NasA family nitrate transporter [Neobacillus notoginsengisoli]RHW42203.1 nitrate/nitrite transporter [Neobacillus notoginsengisoli]